MERCYKCKYWDKKEKHWGECQNHETQMEIHMTTPNYFQDHLYYTPKKGRCCYFDKKPFFSFNNHILHPS